MSQPISLAAARQQVLDAALATTPAVPVALADAAGATLAEAIAATSEWPATDRSAMDGFAVAVVPGLLAGATLPVVGASLAGQPFAGALPTGTAISIMTGAVVPEGANAVVPVEHTSGFGQAQVTLREPVVAGQNIRPRGSELRAGKILLQPGQRLRAAEIGVLAVLGKTQVWVHQPPRVAILATGDEVVPMDCVPLPHQVRESNSWALAAQVAAAGGLALRLPRVADEPAALHTALAHAIATADVVLTIGGVSKGTHDLVHGALAALGVRECFHGIQLKPGKPTYFGVRERGEGAQVVFGLPGNPASTFTVFDLLVRPLLQRLQGRAPRRELPRVRLGQGHWQANSRLQACVCRLTSDAQGLLAQVLSIAPSGDPFALLGGDGYVLIPPRSTPGDLPCAEFVATSDSMDWA